MPAPVRRRAAHRRGGAGRRRERRGWPRGGVLPAVRAVHGDAGDGAGQDRRRGGGQEELRRCELPLQLIVSILSRDRHQWGICQLALTFWSFAAVIILLKIL